MENSKTERDLIDLYLNKKLLQKDIAKILHLSQSTIRLKLKKLNIKRKKVFSEEQRKKLHYASLGNTNSRIFSEKEAIINNRIINWNKWENFRKEILERDSYICMKCKGRADAIHHLKERKKYPELCWDRKNVVSICEKCHININGGNNPEGHNQYGKTKKLVVCRKI